MVNDECWFTGRLHGSTEAVGTAGNKILISYGTGYSDALQTTGSYFPGLSYNNISSTGRLGGQVHYTCGGGKAVTTIEPPILKSDNVRNA
jgi:hypothetical protein